MTTITLSDEAGEVFQEAKDLIDSEAEAVDADRATRGRSADELKNDDVVRVLALAYLGRLDCDE